MNAVSNKIVMSQWETVCQIDELIDNIGACALVNDKQIALFRLSGSETIYAVNNFDPFSNVNAISRGICGDLKGQPVVASPIYKQHFNLITGQCLEDDVVSIPTYSVRVIDKVVQIAV